MKDEHGPVMQGARLGDPEGAEVGKGRSPGGEATSEWMSLPGREELNKD